MGMYDEVICNYPLPGTVVGEFQTKSFENFLEKYIITEEGRLIRETFNLEKVPEEERPFYGKPEWETSPISRMIGSFRRVDIKEEFYDYTGIVNIYTIKNNVWLEYKIKFVDGYVKTAELVKDCDFARAI